QLAKTDVMTTMKETTAAMLSTSRNRWQAGLIVAQMAIALLLITGAGLLIRSFSVLMDVQPGFRTDHLLTMNFSLPLQSYADIEKRTRFYNEVIQRLQRLPGVESVGATTDLPFGSGAVPHNFLIEGRPAIAEGSEPEIFNRGVSTDYFRTMNIVVKKGRVFSDTDRKDSFPVVVINEATAREYFSNEDPIGKRVRWARETPTRWMTVVGVVGDIVPSGLDTKETPALYSPFSQESNWWRTWMNIVMRTH